MGDHLADIIACAARKDRPLGSVAGPFVREHLERSGERDVHFACLWVVNCLAYFARVGHDGPYAFGHARSARVLREMVADSAQLSGSFVVSRDSLDYHPALPTADRRRLEGLVPIDWNHDADA